MKIYNLPYGICYTCGFGAGVVSINGIKAGAIKATKKSYCKQCAPNLHKLHKGAK